MSGRSTNRNNKQQVQKPVETVQVDDSVTTPPPPLETAPKVEEEVVEIIETKPTPAESRRLREQRRTDFLQNAIQTVAQRPENPALAKAEGEPISTEDRPADRPEIFNTIDAVMDPFLERMMPGVVISDKDASELHYGVAMLIRSLLITGGPEMKVGIPYLFAIYRQYANSVFHPQNHHRGVGMMRGSESDINFYRNVSRIFVDLANPDAVDLVLARTDIAHFKKLTMCINSPAAETIAKNLATVLSRASARATK